MSQPADRYQPTGAPIGPYRPARDQTLDASVLLHRLAGAADDPLVAARVRTLRGTRHRGVLTLLDAVADGNDLIVVYDAPTSLLPVQPPIHYRDLLDHVSDPIAALAAWHLEGINVGRLGPDSVLVTANGDWRLVPPVQDAVKDDLREVGILLHWLLSNSAPDPQLSLNQHTAALADGRPLPNNLDRLIDDLLDPAAPSRPAGLTELGQRLRAAAGMAKSTGTSATVQIPSEFSDELQREFPKRPPYVSRGGLNWGWLFLAIVCALVAALIILFRPDNPDEPPPPPPIEESQDATSPPPPEASDEPATEVVATPAPATEPEPEPPPAPGPDPATLAAMQAAFEAMLTARAEAEAVGAPQWASDRWQDLLGLIRQGDAAKAADDPAAAATAWQQAAAMATAIHNSRTEALPGLIAAGNQALAAGDQDDAVRAFQTALAIDPAHIVAGAGLQRARVLNQVLTALAKGAQLEADGAFAAARIAYAEALQLDPAAPGAEAAVKRLDAAIVDEAFTNHLADARKHLADDQLEPAKAAVTKAFDLRPNHPDAVKLAAAVAHRLQQRLAREKFAAGKAAEASEDWQAAYQAYEAAQTHDAALTEAVAAAARAKSRHELATRINQYLADTDQLLVATTRRTASLLVEEVRQLDAATVPKLTAVTDRLALALTELQAPVPVTLASDGNTTVTILKVRRLGAFTSRTLELPPGNYVATGFRNGYQDVRVPFTIKPGLPPPTLEVACTVAF